MRQGIFDVVAALVASAINCDAATLTEDSGIGKHPNWDSINHLNVMMLLEQEFGIEINDASIAKYTSMRAIETLFADRVI